MLPKCSQWHPKWSPKSQKNVEKPVPNPAAKPSWTKSENTRPTNLKIELPYKREHHFHCTHRSPKNVKFVPKWHPKVTQSLQKRPQETIQKICVRKKPNSEQTGVKNVAKRYPKASQNPPKIVSKSPSLPPLTPYGLPGCTQTPKKPILVQFCTHLPPISC